METVSARLAKFTLIAQALANFYQRHNIISNIRIYIFIFYINNVNVQLSEFSQTDNPHVIGTANALPWTPPVTSL